MNCPKCGASEEHISTFAKDEHRPAKGVCRRCAVLFTLKETEQGVEHDPGVKMVEPHGY